MINIRYHIVSITAVFLALGIGVALGSTFLDKATVDVLDRQIDSAEKRIKDTRAENERLAKADELSKERDASLIVVGSERLMADMLTEVPVLVVAAPGVDDGSISALNTVIERTGADSRGVLQLTDKLAKATDADRDLATDLGVPEATAERLRTEADAQLTEALLAAGLPLDEAGLGESDGEQATTTTTTPDGTQPETPTTPDGTQPEVVTTLLDRGYLSLQPGPGYDDTDPILETVGYRYVFIGGPNLTDEQDEAMLALLPAEGPALPATVISATQAPPEPNEQAVPTVVARVRDDEALRSRYNTVDNTETFAGLTATTFTLQDLGDVAPGQYGQADGASAVLPPTS